jgi:hypothetical protein
MDMTCHRKTNCTGHVDSLEAVKRLEREKLDAIQIQLKELNAMAAYRRQQEAEWTKSLQNAAKMPKPKRTYRDIREAARAVAQVAWYGFSTTLIVVVRMIANFIVKGLSKKRGDVQKDGD